MPSTHVNSTLMLQAFTVVAAVVTLAVVVTLYLTVVIGVLLTSVEAADVNLWPCVVTASMVCEVVGCVVGSVMTVDLCVVAVTSLG